MTKKIPDINKEGSADTEDIAQRADDAVAGSTPDAVPSAGQEPEASTASVTGDTAAPTPEPATVSASGDASSTAPEAATASSTGDTASQASEPPIVSTADDPAPPAAGAAGSYAAYEPEAGETKKSSPLLWPLIAVILIAIVLAAALWWQQQRFQEQSATLMQQSRSSAASATQAAAEAGRALRVAQEQATRLTEAENALALAREQLRSLEISFQELTDSSSELVLINDVEHMVSIAQQQLQLNGNVANAIISMEAAQTRLARAGRPGLASLLETINGDLDRLRAVSTVDVGLLSSQLAELSHLVSVAPLHMPDDAAPGSSAQQSPDAAEPAANPTQTPSNGNEQPQSTPDAGSNNQTAVDQPWWRQGWETIQQWSTDSWNSVRQDLGQFVTVRRVDDASALLMSPDQAARFRETMRLRIMIAQLGLMMRQNEVWQSEIDMLVEAIENRYDEQSRDSRRALRIARQLSDVNVAVRLPTVDNSLQAIETWRVEQAAQDEATRTSPRPNAIEPTDSEAQRTTQTQTSPAPDQTGASIGDEPGARNGTGDNGANAQRGTRNNGASAQRDTRNNDANVQRDTGNNDANAQRDTSAADAASDESGPAGSASEQTDRGAPQAAGSATQE